MATKSQYQFQIEPQDVDFTLRAKITHLMSIILNTAGLDADKNRFGVESLNQKNHTWVLSRMALEVDFRPTQYTQCSIETWVNGWDRLFSTRNFRLLTHTQELFAAAVTQWAIIDLDSRRPINLSQEFCDLNSRIVNEPSPIAKPSKHGAVTPSLTRSYRVAYSDIDFNRHMNSIGYVRLIFDILPIEMLERQGKVRMDIHYLNECLYGQTLLIKCDIEADMVSFEIERDDNIVAFRGAFQFL